MQQFISKSKNLVVLTGNAHSRLAANICEHLQIPIGKSVTSRFSDGEIFTEIQQNVRGCEVFVVQPTCAPANDNLFELLIMIDALKRASAAEITAVLPYFGYARQDRKVAPRTPISAKLISDLLSTAGATRVLSIDLHAGQIQGFFNIPFDHIFGMPILLDHMRQHYHGKDLVIVSPDAGGTERARAYAKRLHAQIAMIDKRRERANISQVMNVVGDVQGKIAILLDDIVDTAGTLVNAADALKSRGALEVVAYATHGVLSGKAIDRLMQSSIQKLVVTDTIPQDKNLSLCPKLEVLTVAPLLAEAIRRIHVGESVSSLFV